MPAVARERLLDDPSIDFIVLSAVPCDRAALAIEAMRRGKDVMVDKPGVTTPEQLAAVETGAFTRPDGSGRFAWAGCLAGGAGGAGDRSFR